jgi:hypothetical protein
MNGFYRIVRALQQARERKQALDVWLYLLEYAPFPVRRHDDMLDALSYAMDFGRMYIAIDWAKPDTERTGKMQRVKAFADHIKHGRVEL